MTESLKSRYSLWMAVGISATSAFILLFLMLLFHLIPVTKMEVGMIVGLTIPTVIALYLYPKIYERILALEEKNKKEGRKRILVSFLCFTCFVLLYGIICMAEFHSLSMMCVIIIHYIVVSLGEEFTYRKLIISLLNKKYKTWIAIIVSAFLFAFILHMNEDIVINLFIRFPMGVILGCIAVKTNSIAYTVVLHTIYNLILFIM